jgi:Tc toxin complex TcA C-terminal TcB-binding domain
MINYSSTNSRALSFHNITDATLGAQLNLGTIVQGRPLLRTAYNLKLTYQFQPHFHPYVLQLARKLSATDSVAQMLAMNVQYQTNPADGSIKTIPGSTRALLSNVPGGAQLLDSNQNPVQIGAPLNLADVSALAVVVPAGTTLVGADGSNSTLSATAQVSLTLPISIPNSITNGVQISLPAGTSVTSAGSNSAAALPSAESFIIPDQTLVTLAGAVSATSSDGSPASLPAGSQVLLRTGLPLPQLYEQIFNTSYGPSQYVRGPFPVKDLDFTTSGAYSIYNWELFFHAPLLIAIHLSQNQQFQDAQNWFHSIFDPTDDSDGPTPARFWKVRPFQSTDAQLIEQILVNLSTGENPQLQQDTINSIQAWTQAPFQPFVVAQYRPTAYMLKTVMAYLDNLIAWGDSLFRQYTIETINEATQLYVLAANILGSKPQVVPVKESNAPQTYASIRSNLNTFSDALVDMEVDIPFDTAPNPAAAADPTAPNSIASIGQTLFFCVPQNDTLLGYWDTVADRLFKIHNSLNIQGVFQKLPLFDPPIDPALLVRAAAEGLDVNAIVNGLNQPLPLVRFQLLIFKAAEICQEVKSLGGSLESAFEKGDNEALSSLRSQHESTLLNLAESVKYAQWQDAIKARQALEQSLANASQRYTYYQKLLGMSAAQITIPSISPIDTGGLQNLNFSQSDPSSEPEMNIQDITVDIAQNAPSLGDGEIKTLTSGETEELSKLASANSDRATASTYDHIGAGLAILPTVGGKFQPMGTGGDISFGGSNLAASMSLFSSFYRSDAEFETYEANNAGKLASYSRREQEWIFQSNLAAGELNQIFKQLRGAQIREAIAQNDYKNHRTQMQQAKDIENFLEGTQLPVGDQGEYQKASTVGFYLWMKGAVQGLYSSAFQLAFSVAKKAEQAFQQELGKSDLSYIQSNYLDGMEGGLLAGEKLLFDVKRMEMDYHDLNVREYELTKHVSLLQVAPLALVQLRATGSCLVSIPEALFDLDGPGHYFRRIKSVAVTIPCVTGPYTGVNCTLSLQNSFIRTSSQISGSGYPDRKNFSANYGTTQAMVTSSGQVDSGLFETNLRDERYLPFEYSGVISQWQLELPANPMNGEPCQFDFDTITDVILHIRYTAREGGEILRSAAVANLQQQIANAQTVGSVRLFSIRHEFPGEWAKFRSVTIGGTTVTAGLSLNLLPQHYPFWAQPLLGPSSIKQIQFLGEMTDGTTSAHIYANAAGTSASDSLAANPAYGNLVVGTLKNAIAPWPPPPTGPINLYFDHNLMKDLWLAITWGKGT